MDSECLAAFVFPNHPDVSQIMDGVRKRLAAEIKDGSTDGYQSFARGTEEGSKKVHFIAKAIFEELQSLGLNYSNPPVSFEGFGQKIRTPDVVIRDRASTCLDSTVLVASTQNWESGSSTKVTVASRLLLVVGLVVGLP